MQGWIKLHRKALETSFANRPAYVSLWVHLLLSANHKEKSFIWNGEEKTLQPGQLITGRKQLSITCGVPESTVEDILNFFQKSKIIQQQKTSKYRLITLLKWQLYQSSNNKATTSQQLADTNKNEKNEKNVTSDKSQDMNWNQKSDEHEEGVVDYDSGELTEPKKPQTKKYPNAPAIRKIFQEVLGRDPANWKMNKTQLQACENLYTERTPKSVRSALEYYKENKEEKYCPKINSPYDLDSKWTMLGEFKLKQNGN